jgi:hypothetical protein
MLRFSALAFNFGFGGILMIKMNIIDIIGVVTGSLIIIAWGVMDYLSTKKNKHK